MALDYKQYFDKYVAEENQNSEQPHQEAIEETMTRTLALEKEAGRRVVNEGKRYRYGSRPP